MDASSVSIAIRFGILPKILRIDLINIKKEEFETVTAMENVYRDLC
jgi:hypothetical protein